MNSQISLNSKTFYQNSGNRSILQFLDESDRHILDIGCGAGSNGQLICETYPETEVTGVTCSQEEYQLASQQLSRCIYADVERDIFTLEQQFDVLLFCHVLEHLVDPVAAIKKLLPYLRVGGKLIIALPNIANWRSRSNLLLGKFEYTDGGIMDKTHLHFYTFHTAPLYLITPISQLRIEQHFASGSFPFGRLRDKLLGERARKEMDRLVCGWLPNLFSHEILMQAVKIN